MAKAIGKASWNFGKPEEKPQLTAEKADAKARETCRRYGDVLINFGLACDQLATAGDVLGLSCIALAAKELLAEAAEKCADAAGVGDLME